MVNDDSRNRRIYSEICAPIIFSITGHVDIPPSQVESIYNKIGALFDDFISRYPHTEFILMSALAEGADRIAASAAKERGIKLAPVLPKIPSEYEKTFSSEESKKEFYKILDENTTLYPCIVSTDDGDERESFRALSAYLISNSHIMIAVWDGRIYDRNGGTYDTIRMGFMGIDPDLKRIAHPMSPVSDNIVSVPNTYLTISEDCLLYIIQTDRMMSEDLLVERGCMLEYGKLPENTCGYLIPKLAYGDAVAAESSSKLHHTIFFKNDYDRRADADEFKISDRILIEAPPDGLPQGHQINEYDKSEYSRREIPTYYSRIFNKIDELNSDMGVADNGYVSGSIADGVLASKSKQDELWNSRFYLLSDNADSIKELGCMDEMATRYQVADSLAMKNQKKSFRTMLYIIAINILSGLFFQLYILVEGATFTVFLYIVLMLSGNLIYATYQKGAAYSKFIEYRTLAEAMRVNYYWGLSGINDTASSSCYGYMKNELSWVRAVVKSWGSYFLNDYSSPSKISWEERASCVCESWINGQIKYHDSKLEKNKKAYWKNDTAIKIILSLLSVFSAAAIILNMFATDWMNSSVIIIEPVSSRDIVWMSTISITVLMLFKLAMVALTVMLSCVTSLRNRIHGGTPNQILAKLSMFDLASIRLKQAREISDTLKAHTVSAEIFTELGNQCMTEVSDWAFENKTKDVEPTRERITPNGKDSE